MNRKRRGFFFGGAILVIIIGVMLYVLLKPSPVEFGPPDSPVLTAAVSHSASGSTRGRCDAEVTLLMSPGLALDYSEGTNRSFVERHPREPDWVHCRGSIGGYKIASYKGSLGFRAHYSGTCLDIKGDGDWFLDFYVRGGDGRLYVAHGAGTYRGPGRVGFIHFTGTFTIPGTSIKGKVDGRGPARPRQGTCTKNKPLTQVRFAMRDATLTVAAQ